MKMNHLKSLVGRAPQSARGAKGVKTPMVCGATRTTIAAIAATQTTSAASACAKAKAATTDDHVHCHHVECLGCRGPLPQGLGLITVHGRPN